MAELVVAADLVKRGFRVGSRSGRIVIGTCFSGGRPRSTPAEELGDGVNTLHLRLAPARNNQSARIRMADEYRMPTIRRTGP